ncbi:hypothetical protein J2X69_004006 [Algoriphagus sp. 4150]|uniref:hypothetical protein n=1 Tax=Algoriphagus sp. 4150 TaxID=2817756 RepID=UPI00285B3704|nr:hypothetical protein [Algoriphagus sp. 4150]MDR7131642.1 hypothetical protein [Algoriphagus sp. 4150]
MLSLKEHINRIRQEEWDYYSEIGGKNLQNPFTGKIDHFEFLRQFFSRSGKSQVLEIMDFLPNGKLDNNRTKHTNSIFFLGILLYERTNLRSPFFEEENASEYRRFPFLWFLACLFHDFGFTIENDRKSIYGIKNIADLKRKYNIQNCLLDTNPRNVNETLFSLIEPYFDFRLKEHTVIDHGIFAGLFFYDRLKKIRENKFNQRDTDHFWNQELEEQYAQVASAIATHNMWLPGEENFDLYRSYELNRLIDDFKPVKFNDFPLLFLLGIVDTIDPMKLYQQKGFSPDEILRSVYIEFNGESITVMNGQKSRLDFKLLIQKANTLKGWIKADVEFRDSVIEIKLIQ